MMRSRQHPSRPQWRGCVQIQVPADRWYLPVLTAVAADSAVTADLPRDVIGDVRVVTAEIGAALCLRSEPDEQVKLSFQRLDEGLRIVGSAPARNDAPPGDSTPAMRQLRRTAHNVAAVCMVDRQRRARLWMTATVQPQYATAEASDAAP